MINKKIINDVFSNYGRILSEYIYLSKFKKGSLNKYVKISGSKYLEDIKTNNKKVIFSSQDNGRHNETSWATAILEILGQLI